MKNLVTENKDINKSVSLRLNKSLLEEINKITEVFSISLTDFIRETDDSVLDGHTNSSRLVVTLRKMFERTYAELIRNVTITTVAVSPEEQKKRIIELFRNRNEVSFKEIFDVPTKGHFVITLLAVLDLARQQIVVMEQLENEGIIKFTKGAEYE